MLERHTIPIGEVYSGMYDGPHATPNPSESGPIFLGIKNVGESGQLDFSDVRHISEEEYSRWIRRVEPKYGDIVFSYEATLNRYAMIPKGFRGCLGRRMALIRPDESKACGRFLYYYFYGHEWRNVIAQNTLVGSTVDRIPIAKFPNFPVNVPSLPTQRKIAAILSAYDDLIANNLRRIKILEEMAQNLYREWFVEFRFPGHQRARFTDSPLGRIPEGWEVKRLGDAFLIVLGGTPSRDRPEFWRNGTVPWINSGKVNDLRVTEPSELITELALKKSAAKLMPPGTTLIAITGATLGQVSILEIEASANQSVVGVISEDEKLIEWLHLTIRERISSIINHASGGAQQHINKGIVDDVVVAVPPGNIPEKFHNVAQPLYRHIEGLIFKSTTLRRTRDLLLPRLISGELDVSALDIAIPDEVAT